MTRSGLGSPTSGCLHQSTEKPCRGETAEGQEGAHTLSLSLRHTRTHRLGASKGHSGEGVAVEHQRGALLQLLLHLRPVVADVKERYQHFGDGISVSTTIVF